jgi:hypothetical protein
MQIRVLMPLFDKITTFLKLLVEESITGEQSG